MARPKIHTGPCSISGCDRPASCRGWCHTHYTRFWRHGDPSVGDWRQRFEAQIHRATSCWIWTGPRFKSGYGRASQGSKKRRAHRVAYEIFVGTIPDGMHVLHKCDNPPCVNPEHLFLGTHIDNMRDMEAKGRARWIQDNLRRAQA